MNKPFATLVILGCSALFAACVPPPDETQLSIGSPGGATSVAPGTGGETSTGGSGTGGASTGGTTGTGGAFVDAGAGADVTPGRDAGNADSGRGGTGAGGRNAATGGTTGTGAGGVAASVCTSKTTYSGGNGPTMRPGASCRGCHGFTVSGTIYQTAHEPTNCNGVNGSTGIRVVITGANGQTLTLTPSAAGNFYSNTQVGASFTAKLTTTAGATRSMLTMQTSGDCNSCHTQNGANGAPGRIMAP